MPMTRKVLPTRVLTLSAAALFVAAAHAAATAPAIASEKSLKPAVTKYLEKNGDFCLGKFEWPILVSADDRKAGTNNALQMPVLEKLGLVESADAASDPTVRAYSLTEEGRKYYLTKRTITVNSAGQKIRHPGDFCPARLKLAKVVSWDNPNVVAGQTQTTVKYTYKVVKAAGWAQDPDVRKVFPMIPKILDNAGNLQLMQLFAWSDHGWVAVIPGE
jgi:hypothetical protein